MVIRSDCILLLKPQHGLVVFMASQSSICTCPAGFLPFAHMAVHPWTTHLPPVCWANLSDF